MSEKPYTILGVIDADEVPDWERRRPKWDELIDAVMALEPNKTIEIAFPSAREAKRASNAVRDGANLRAEAVVVRTRVVYNKEDDEGATLFLTRVKPIEK